MPYWLRLKDPRGGFFGEVQSDGTVQPDAPRGVILNARLVWSFAAAYAALKDEQYLEAAVYARDWFLDHFFDPQYGGVYWSVSFGGEALDAKKQLYAQGFAIYGLSELCKVTRDDQALQKAIDLYQVWPDEGLKAAVERLLLLVGTRIMAPSGHLQLYFQHGPRHPRNRSHHYQRTCGPDHDLGPVLPFPRRHRPPDSPPPPAVPDQQVDAAGR